MASQPIYQFYAELSDFAPTIWRRLQVAGNITVARLAYIVMTMFEMRASHLFCVEVPRADNVRSYIRQHHTGVAHKLDVGPPAIQRFEIPDEEAMPVDDVNIQTLDATQWKISRVLSHTNEQLRVNYDYGDNWWVIVTLEGIISDSELAGNELPRVLEGAGYGIVEDCGGTPGLEELAQVMRTKKGKRYAELSDWLGVDELDLASFDIDDMNYRLKKIPRIYTQCYERRLYPTQQSIDLIERKYLDK